MVPANNRRRRPRRLAAVVPRSLAPFPHAPAASVEVIAESHSLSLSSSRSFPFTRVPIYRFHSFSGHSFLYDSHHSSKIPNLNLNLTLNHASHLVFKMKGGLAAAALAAMASGVAAAHHRHAHEALFKKSLNGTNEVCTPLCTTVWTTFYGEPTRM